MKLLPLEQLIEISKIKFMLSFHLKIPFSFSEMWQLTREEILRELYGMQMMTYINAYTRLWI
jgi:hypothetical protein